MSVSLVYRFKQPALIDEQLGVDEYGIAHTRTVANPAVGKWKTVTVKVEVNDEKAIHEGAACGGVYGIRTNNGNPVAILPEFQNATSALIHFRQVEADDRKATKEAIDAGEPIRKVGRPAKVLTLAQEADEYYKTKKGQALTNNMHHVGGFVATLHDSTRLTDFTKNEETFKPFAEMFEKWFAGLVEKKKTENVVNTAYRHVIGFLGESHCNLQHELWKSLPRLAYLKKEYTPVENIKDHTDHFTVAEQQSLRKVAKDRERIMLELGLQLALREAEIVNAKWSSVNWHTRTYTVTANLGSGIRTKSRKARTIRFGTGLAAMLKSWKQTSGCKSEYILCGSNGKQQWVKDLYYPMQQIAIRAGIDIKLVWPHKLRHSAITNWLHAGMPPTDCQKWAGHKNLETTCLYFGNLEDKEVTKRLDAFFGD